tara:strand:- start:537 stop:1379 length:843 start_codon:yes stop_codon:yes gene_type:complete
MKSCIGGVILYDETIKQSVGSSSIPELISSSGAVPGIKVDTGAKTLSSSKEEKITEGLDGLRERLKEYHKLGARFAKWRGVYSISESFPSKVAVSTNSHALARYASLVQESGMVPIVEPEVLMDGDHNSKTCLDKTTEVIKKCFEELILQKVDLKGVILKPNMILPGTASDEKINSEKIAELTLKCLNDSVPKEIPGIAFLSGGQTEKQATENLNMINLKNNSDIKMTFSYGRALQQSALKYWSENQNDIEGTKKVFNHRANMCTLAAKGEWNKEFEKNE